ncbi:response regulator [Xanthocytophaga agilis]|uniref:Response regulator n=1 Tax=Xanthocytophaga agilis TaxID=3048010 RepID=A0AAE3UDZ8_9BACT|nr:response regulator [Xanthocytophaga agilis]MDJ1501735.1 response regulator [Xanthocytophaga agilis]
MAFSLLIVEDDPDEMALLSIIFRKYFPSWKFLFLSEYDELMDFLTNGSIVSFILLDMHLVVNNGTMIVSEIRQLHWYTQIPIAGYSSACSPSAVANFLENGGDYFFEKPYSLDEIVAQLKELPYLQPNTNRTIKTHTYLQSFRS